MCSQDNESAYLENNRTHRKQRCRNIWKAEVPEPLCRTHAMTLSAKVALNSPAGWFHNALFWMLILSVSCFLWSSKSVTFSIILWFPICYRFPYVQWNIFRMFFSVLFFCFFPATSLLPSQTKPPSNLPKVNTNNSFCTCSLGLHTWSVCAFYTSKTHTLFWVVCLFSSTFQLSGWKARLFNSCAA